MSTGLCCFSRRVVSGKRLFNAGEISSLIVSGLDLRSAYSLGCVSTSCAKLRDSVMRNVDWLVYAFSIDKGTFEVHCDCYSVKQHVWRPLPSIPRETMIPPTASTTVPPCAEVVFAVVLRSQLYSLIGFKGVDHFTLLTYDRLGRAWKRLMQPPVRVSIDVEFFGRSVITHAGALFVVGEQKPEQSIRRQTVARFAPGGRWELLPSLPVPRVCRLVSCGGRLYSLGQAYGSGCIQRLSAFECWEHTSKRWRSLPTLGGDLLCPVSCGTLYSVGRFIVCFNDQSHTVWTYDSLREAWTPCPSMPRTRRFTKTCVFKGAMYVFGGRESHGSELSMRKSKDVDVFVPPIEGDGKREVCTVADRMQCLTRRNTWMAGPRLVSPFAERYIVPADQSCVFAVGTGKTSMDTKKGLYCLLPAHCGWGTWEKLAPMPRRQWYGVAAVGPRLQHHSTDHEWT